MNQRREFLKALALLPLAACTSKLEKADGASLIRWPRYLQDGILLVGTEVTKSKNQKSIGDYYGSLRDWAGHCEGGNRHSNYMASAIPGFH